MKNANDLRSILERIDHRGYPAYKDTAGEYGFSSYIFSIDHVQGDPFAAPSDVSVRMKSDAALFPGEYYDSRYRRIALQDMIIRRFFAEIGKYSFKAKGSGKSGMISVGVVVPEVLEKSACTIKEDGEVVMRFKVGFPANGRTVNSGELTRIIFDFIPKCVRASLCYSGYEADKVRDVIYLADDQHFIREELKRLGLVAFVADGSILPRESGVSGRPLKSAVPFKAPDSMAVTLDLPHKGKTRGMGIRKGITMIAGGGYHGKSTLLEALQRGVYDHIRGDGREYVITNDSAVKLRAEDGRSITDVDISMFIDNLPNGRDTANFSTKDASGSTSQAANVIEAMEAGCRVFLIDEDTSAANFMIRDELMQSVVQKDSEPIIPFIDRVEELYHDFGVSTILVAGSCGSYFHKADIIVQMKNYEPIDITDKAKTEAERFPLVSIKPDPTRPPRAKRMVKYTGRLSDRIKIKANGTDGVVIDKELIDLRYVEQLADLEQTAMLGVIMKYAIEHLMDGRHTVAQIADEICGLLDKKGMSYIYGGRYLPCGYAMPRKHEIAACVNRCRAIKVE